MKTTTLQTKSMALLRRVENEKRQPATTEKAQVAHREMEFLLLGALVLGLLWRFFGAWIGRESIRIQKEPGKFVSRAEEYQDLHTQVGLNTFFRMH